MKLYLSSYGLGKDIEKLKSMLPAKAKVAFIPNALDYVTDTVERLTRNEEKTKEFQQLGYQVEIIDLKNYFGKEKELREKLQGYDLWRVRGGNVFVLRQAMHLSGFDTLLHEFSEQNTPIVYGGYSAGVCVLGPTLRGLELVDDPTQRPYGTQHERIRKGLGIIDYAIAPHYRSDHPESRDVEKTVQYFIDHKILFKALRDGEVIILE